MPDEETTTEAEVTEVTTDEGPAEEAGIVEAQVEPEAPTGPEMITVEIPDDSGAMVPVTLPKSQYDQLAVAGYYKSINQETPQEEAAVEADEEDPLSREVQSLKKDLQNIQRRFFQTDMVDAAAKSELAQGNDTATQIIADFATALMASDTTRSLTKSRAAAIAEGRLKEFAKSIGGEKNVEKYLHKKVKDATAAEGGSGGGTAMTPKRKPATKDDLVRGVIAQRLRDRITAGRR